MGKEELDEATSGRGDHTHPYTRHKRDSKTLQKGQHMLLLRVKGVFPLLICNHHSSIQQTVHTVLEHLQGDKDGYDRRGSSVH